MFLTWSTAVWKYRITNGWTNPLKCIISARGRDLKVERTDSNLPDWNMQFDSVHVIWPLLNWLWFPSCWQLQRRRRETEQTERALWHWSLSLQAKVTQACWFFTHCNFRHRNVNLMWFCQTPCRCCMDGGCGSQSSAGNKSRPPELHGSTETSCWGRAWPASSPTLLTWTTSPRA